MKYDEPHLKRLLDELPKKPRIVFAAQCAERLAPAYPPFAERNGRDPNELALLLERLWQDLDGAEMSRDAVQAHCDLTLALVPDDDDPWFGLAFYASDAAAAVAYAFSVRLTGDSQDAAWAARRAYEALDYFVVTHAAIDRNVPGAEARILSDPRIQQELTRQRRDLDELGSLAKQPLRPGIPDALRQRAKAEAYHFLIG
jgi:uncharacterized protein YjaG (DUF416 family)